MAIDKRIPRVLDSDSDNKTVNKVSMKDALNVYAGPDNEGFSGGSKSDAGNQILKNIRGNTEVFVHEGEELPTDARVIGFVEDVKTDITYFFVYSSEGSNHGVWAYDKNDILNTLQGGGVQQGPSIRLIYKSAQFNFPQNGFVKADVVYTNASKSLESLGDDFDKDVLIYFTDGKNEPRKLNAYRAFAESSGSEIYGDDVYAEADFICACPRVPLKPISFIWGSDETRKTSNFSRTSGFKFAYQYKYKDGTQSAISPYSDVAFPPSIVNQGAQSYIDHAQYNRLRLFVSTENTSDVDSIIILSKEGSTGNFFVLDEISIFGVGGNFQYDFFNDKISRGVSLDEVNKQFDSVPRIAKTQTVTSNRLMYGNYVDGFDGVDTNAQIIAVYKERGEDFKTFEIDVQTSIAPLSEELGEDYSNAKTTGFLLDCSGLPDTINADTTISFSITIGPQRNWHIYEFKNGSSFHASRALGPQTAGTQGLNTGANTATFYNQSNNEAGKPFYNSVYGNMFGQGTSVSDNCIWRVKDTPSVLSGNSLGVVGNQNINCSYGTSAGNPLIIKGGQITFKMEFTVNGNVVSNGGEFIADVIDACLTELPGNLPNVLASYNVTLSEEEGDYIPRPSYSYDLPLSSGDLLSQPYLLQDGAVNDYTKLITSVRRTDLINDYVPDYGVPCGHFIVKSATAKFFCEKVENEGDDPNDDFNFTGNKRHFRVGISSISDVELLTCLHDIPVVTSYEGGFTWSTNPAATSWILMDENDANLAAAEGVEEFFDLHNISGVNVNQYGSWVTGGAPQFPHQYLYLLNANYLSQVGFLDFSSGSFFDAEAPEDQGDQPFMKYCVLDGQGGVAGSSSATSYNNKFLSEQGSVTVNPTIVSGEIPHYENTMFFAGDTAFAGRYFAGQTNEYVTLFPLIRRQFFNNGNMNAFYVNPIALDGNPLYLDPDSVDFNLLHSYPSVLSAPTIISEGVYGFDRSFKTDANHDFGIVYYDQRGRHGFVNRLGNVFIDGYSLQERGSALYGPAHVRITLNHAPPSWAHHYKIVYAGNTSVRDFVQYTAGGAFIKAGDQPEPGEDNLNIYVSLNYLQGHPVSYVSSFGARTSEGGLNFYKFEPGDKLKVISYGPGDNREYAYDAEFEVVDFVKLGEEDNPLSDGPDVPSNKRGDFVVIKNNPSAFGFTAVDIAVDSSFWGQNTVIELRTPEREKSTDELLYYEIGATYDVVIEDGVLKHDQESIELNNGDVWFRPVATNVRPIEDGVYVDIIKDVNGTDDPLVESNFTSVLLESKSASDLFRSDNSFLGRPNVIFEDAAETRREATITYSDPTNPEGTRLNYSSFNASLANFKDLSERYGDIQYMSDYGDYAVVIQKEKITIVPVNKNVLSNADGSQRVVASTSVLNEAIVYPGVSGCDNDPSSVYDSGQEIYFCNKTFSKVYRWTKSGGVEEISEKGMSSFIRAAIQRAKAAGQLRIVGGFDPIKDEYLLTLDNLPVLNTQNAVEVLQPIKEAEEDDDDGQDDDGQDNDQSSDLPPLEIIPDPIVFSNIQFGPGANSSGNVSIILQANEDLNITNIEFSDPRFTLASTANGAEQVYPIVLIPSQGLNIYPITITYSPDSVDDVFAEVDISTNLEGQSPFAFDIEATSMFVGEDDPLPDEAFSLAEALNNFYPGSTYTAEDMSAQLAIEYLQALASSPLEDQPTGNQIKQLLNSVNSNSMKRLVLDTYGDNNNAVSDTTDSQDFLGLIGPSGILGDTFDPGLSIFQDNEVQTGLIPPPVSNNPPPNFETAEEAVQYLEQNRVLRLHDVVRLNKYSNPNIVLNTVDRLGIQIINSQDLLAVLSAFGSTMNGMDSPYGSQPTDYDTAEYTGSQVIDQIVTDFIDTITVEQYHRILNDQYPNPNTGVSTSGIDSVAAMIASSGAYSGYFGADFDYTCSSPTLLFFLSQYGADNGITLEGLAANPDLL